MKLRHVFAGSILLASNVAAADRIKVAVVPGIAVNLDAARVDALSQDLAEGLAADLDVDAVGGLEVRRQLPPDGLPPDCATNAACTKDVAKRTGAQQLLFVVMVDSGAGGAVQVDTTWVEPATGKSASRPPIDLTSTIDADAKAKFEAAATRLLPDAPVKKKPVSGGSTNVIVQSAMVGGEPKHLTTPAYVTGGVAIVGLGLGAVMGLQARSKYNDCQDHAGTCTASQKDTIRTDDHLADLGWGLGAAGAIATIVLYATSGTEPHLEVSPTTNGGATVTYFGSF
ncbi:MAG: hypothetical protein JO257_03960 [Deltaproteobacteria bacterium]|nr:hypothetical protein [Deltaproteobacteria bacterium]